MQPVYSARERRAFHDRPVAQLYGWLKPAAALLGGGRCCHMPARAPAEPGRRGGGGGGRVLGGAPEVAPLHLACQLGFSDRVGVGGVDLRRKDKLDRTLSQFRRSSFRHSPLVGSPVPKPPPNSAPASLPIPPESPPPPSAPAGPPSPAVPPSSSPPRALQWGHWQSRRRRRPALLAPLLGRAGLKKELLGSGRPDKLLPAVPHGSPPRGRGPANASPCCSSRRTHVRICAQALSALSS